MRIHMRDKKLAVETCRLTIEMPDGTEFELYAVEDSNPPRPGKGLVVMAAGGQNGIYVRPSSSNNVIIVDVD